MNYGEVLQRYGLIFSKRRFFFFRHGSPRTALNLGIAVLQNGNEEMTTHLERTYRQIDAPTLLDPNHMLPLSQLTVGETNS